MTAQSTDEKRKAALDAYLAECKSRGFQLESRTNTQAIVVRRPRFARYRSKRCEVRLVAWVDEHAVVETLAVKARRW